MRVAAIRICGRVPAALAPTCAHCGVKIAGHGMESEGTMYCCAHCAQHMGVTEVADRV